MNSPLKNTLVVILAFLVGGFVISITEQLISLWFPIPLEISLNDTKSIEFFTPNTSDGKLALVLLSHGIAAFFSGIIISHFAKTSSSFLIIITGLIWTMIGVINIVTTPHPIWFSISDTCIYLPMTILGCKITLKTK